jgi:hypothetical protein
MEVMETTKKRKLDTRDVNESEDTITSEEYGEEEKILEKLIRIVTKVSARLKPEVPMYEGNPNVEEFIYWINSLDKYFDYEDVDEEKNVKNAVTRIKGHMDLW